MFITYDSTKKEGWQSIYKFFVISCIRIYVFAPKRIRWYNFFSGIDVSLLARKLKTVYFMYEEDGYGD